MKCHQFVTDSFDNVQHEIQLADKEQRKAKQTVSPELRKLYDSFGLDEQLNPIADQPKTAIPANEICDLADRLWQAKGASLIVSDSQDIEVQILVNYINHALGNYGKTLTVARPSHQRQGDDNEVARLVDDLRSGKVAALFATSPKHSP